MDFSFTEEQLAVKRLAREFADREIRPYIARWDRERHFPQDLPRKMGEQGLLGVCLPRRYEGSGLDYVALALVCEEIEKAETAYREILSVHVALHALTLLQWGSEEQKRRFLPDLATGRRLAAFGLTEPDAGSDVAGLRTTARRDGGSYVLNGQKTWISYADRADVFLVFARTDPEAPRHEGISAFIVERGTPGFTTSTIEGKLGVWAGNTGSLHFADARVPVENRLGEEGEGFKIAMSALDNGRLTVAAGSVGLIEACLEASVAYARTRRAFGRPIGEFQLVQRMIAKMVRARDTSRWVTYYAAWLKNQGRRATREVALAKWHATTLAFESAVDAVQIHGAYGFSSDFPVERYMRNAKGAVIYEGTTEVQEVLQAEYALGLREDRPLRRELPAWPFAEDAGQGG
ncbi:MAG: acyl-CoA dehydrogenase family protein [Clostridia bacterium]|nr:acyl-CoA dehydrogenase family protein [Clostridia bacterium]